MGTVLSPRTEVMSWVSNFTLFESPQLTIVVTPLTRSKGITCRKNGQANTWSRRRHSARAHARGRGHSENDVSLHVIGRIIERTRTRADVLEQEVGRRIQNGNSHYRGDLRHYNCLSRHRREEALGVGHAVQQTPGNRDITLGLAHGKGVRIRTVCQPHGINHRVPKIIRIVFRRLEEERIGPEKIRLAGTVVGLKIARQPISVARGVSRLGLRVCLAVVNVIGHWQSGP